MIGWVANSKVHVTDRFIFDRNGDGSGVRLDLQQDWVAVGGEESVNGSTGETWTTIHFWRYLDTGDCNDRPILSGRLMQTVWSYGESLSTVHPSVKPPPATRLPPPSSLPSLAPSIHLKAHSPWRAHT